MHYRIINNETGIIYYETGELLDAENMLAKIEELNKDNRYYVGELFGIVEV